MKQLNTILLENDQYLHAGTHEFLAKLGDHAVFNPSIRDSFFEGQVSMAFCMELAQPNIAHAVSVSAFENIVASRQSPSGSVNQLEFYVPLVEAVNDFRRRAMYEPIHYHLVYLGGSVPPPGHSEGLDSRGDGGPLDYGFIDALHRGIVGKSTLGELARMFRQDPDGFLVSVYDEDFKLVANLDAGILVPLHESVTHE